MNTVTKILISFLAIAALGAAGFFVSDNIADSRQNKSSNPENIVTDYKNLLAEAEKLKVSAGSNCDNEKSIKKQIDDMEKKLADLAARKKDWLDNVPKLPELNLEELDQEDPFNLPGSEVPELTSDVPPLPDIDPDLIVIEEVPGSQVPELTSDVPPLPDINIELIDSEYIPELPEINPGRPGSEVPELTSDVPPLPDITEINIIDPNEYIFQIEEHEQKINNILQELKTLCQDKENTPAKKKVISDKCSDACQRHKNCAAYTEDVTPDDLNDAYDACMEECPTWSKEIIKCINAIDIKTPNDCVSFVQCQLPRFYEEEYLQ